MFGIGLPEMIVIFAVALIVVGPDKLPDLARSLAKGIMEMKKTLNQVKENLTEEENVLGDVQKDLKKTADDLKNQMLDVDTQTWKKPLIDATTGSKDEEVIDLKPDTGPRPWEEDAGRTPEVQPEQEDPPSSDQPAGEERKDQDPPPTSSS